jgi:ribosome biogenesis GTPase A
MNCFLVLFLIQIMKTVTSFHSLNILSKYGTFRSATRNFAVNPKLSRENQEFLEELNSATKTSLISWYPGHIAKAEKELAEYLKRVDVVIEVRDARIPYATTHPSVPKWIGNKPLIIAIARLDQVSKLALNDWKKYYETHPAHKEKPDAKIFFIDGKRGTGTLALKKEALKAGKAINAKRIRKGIQPRAVRAAVIGFPNVGKSALINRLLGRRMAKSRNLPGVTRQITWVRIGGGKSDEPLENTIELLDSPGIIPAQQFNQQAAVKLAICNDIGQAAYDPIVIAAEMCNALNEIYRNKPQYVNMKLIQERYKLPDFTAMSGEEIVDELARRFHHENVNAAADRLLSDFRNNRIEFGSLESPIFTNVVASVSSKSHRSKRMEEDDDNNDIDEEEDIQPGSLSPEENEIVNPYNKPKRTKKEKKQEKRKERQENEEKDEKPPLTPLDVGKGNYEGW